MKMNSVTDMDFIRKVAEASRAGVKVDLIVRGICCIHFDSCSIYLYSRDDICVFADGFRTVDTD